MTREEAKKKAEEWAKCLKNDYAIYEHYYSWRVTETHFDKNGERIIFAEFEFEKPVEFPPKGTPCWCWDDDWTQKLVRISDGHEWFSEDEDFSNASKFDHFEPIRTTSDELLEEAVEQLMGWCAIAERHGLGTADSAAFLLKYNQYKGETI